MIHGIKTLGRSRFSRILVNGSKTEYEMKKIVSERLYWLDERPSSDFSPTSFALPIFVLLKLADAPLEWIISLDIPIQERNQVEQTEPGNKSNIKLP